jgi:hypothetical protein
MAQQLHGAYKGTNGAFLAEHPTAGHASIVGQVPQLADPLLIQCRNVL